MSDNVDVKDVPPPRTIPVTSTGFPILPLDAEYYAILSEEEISFFKAQTGITDNAELKDHIIKVQAEAYAVYPYPCIRGFAFAKLKISRFPAYKELLRLGKERPGALFLDIGCCFGNDIRKAVADGYPVDQVIGSDLRPEYWELGHKLFRSTPETFPAAFVPGDALSEDFLRWEPLLDTAHTAPAPDLHNLKTLTPLSGRISAIHASLFFHLFDESTQFRMAHLLSSLLSPEPGSIIFGIHLAAKVKGMVVREYSGSPETRREAFAHSPESWKELWEREIFREKKIKVWGMLREISRDGVPGSSSNMATFLIWSITRL